MSITYTSNYSPLLIYLKLYLNSLIQFFSIFPKL